MFNALNSTTSLRHSTETLGYQGGWSMPASVCPAISFEDIRNPKDKGFLKKLM